MFQKLKNIYKKDFWNNFRDIRFLGFLIFGIMVVLASWSGVSVIEANYVLQKQITQLDQHNQVQQLENTNLKLKNEYYNTDTYLELQARKSLGKGAPGETLILVPKEIALNYVQNLPATSTIQTNAKPQEKSKFQRNFDDWMKFLFHLDS